MELGLADTQTEGWVWPKQPILSNPFKGFSRFLRYPGPENGLGYRAMRVGVITVLRVKTWMHK